MLAGSRTRFYLCPILVGFSQGSACDQVSDCDGGDFVWTATVDYFSGCKKINPGARRTFDSVAKVENKHTYSKMMTIFLQSGDLGEKKEIFMYRTSPLPLQVTGKSLWPSLQFLLLMDKNS